MTGIRKTAVVLQARDRHLLSELGVMRIIDRETAKVVAGFASTTRANTRLLQLVRAGLLRRFFVGTISSGRKSIYTLSAKGAETVQAQAEGIDRPAGRLLVGDRFVEHQSAVNEAYVAIKYGPRPHPDFRLLRWLSFRREITESVQLKPDGYCEVQTGGQIRAMFLEVDLGTEALSVWQEKTARYLHLAISGEFQRRFRQPQFRVLVVANSERRLEHVRTMIAKQTDKIFWLSTFETIHRHGFWSPCWLRPAGGERQALL